MSLHREILTERQRKVLRFLGPKSAADGFYLAGGTAIALHLGHRQSVHLAPSGTKASVYFCHEL